VLCGATNTQVELRLKQEFKAEVLCKSEVEVLQKHLADLMREFLMLQELE